MADGWSIGGQWVVIGWSMGGQLVVIGWLLGGQSVVNVQSTCVNLW